MILFIMALIVMLINFAYLRVIVYKKVKTEKDKRKKLRKLILALCIVYSGLISYFVTDDIIGFSGVFLLISSYYIICHISYNQPSNLLNNLVLSLGFPLVFILSIRFIKYILMNVSLTVFLLIIPILFIEKVEHKANKLIKNICLVMGIGIMWLLVIILYDNDNTHKLKPEIAAEKYLINEHDIVSEYTYSRGGIRGNEIEVKVYSENKRITLIYKNGKIIRMK
ncbi:hypothetical protein EDC19_1829 [Natranaerovirga hydrolytica]|uniref:Uncharacterized protein n=1 Tax=Natranaerovirga hydrolytica TaxID=680378 RepID=A0A4R1MJP5_9FIRM|nr:hypothetical protein [Natranaerovirga hydrolytica]TCK92675.1 hypothetical protein EDC19_1829 [Natranaerovirga hydrolytica]